MLIKIKNRYNGNVLFSHDCEENTLKITLDMARKAQADLAGADLTGANLAGAPSVPNIHQVIYAAASAPGALNMGSWHCGTTHCRAGWVITIAGEAGKALEDKIGTPAAAMAIYMASDTERWKTERLPNFYCDNENALADMRRMAEEESKQA